MKWIFLFLGLLLSNLVISQKHVENQPADEKGAFYTGSLKKGKYHGLGTYYYSFKRGYYQGEWKDGIKHGKGMFVQFSGNTNSGNWVDDQLIGETQYEYVNEGDILFRTRENGRYTDNYKLVYHNGTVLEGTTINGKLEGVFTFKFQDGTKKELTFKDDGPAEREGFIKDGFAYYKRVENGYYNGDWHNEKPHGKGGFIGSIVYRGDWVNGVKEGQGYIYYGSNDTYRGGFKNGVRHGKGILRFDKTKAYAEGVFQNNFLEGIGTFTLSSGSILKGNMFKGQFHGEVVTTDAAGNVSTSFYENGEELKAKPAEIIAQADNPPRDKPVTERANKTESSTVYLEKTEVEDPPENRPATEQVNETESRTAYPTKLEGEDLMHFLFAEYRDEKVAYWLEKHPEELFKEVDWEFYTPGIKIAYYTGNYGANARKSDKPNYYDKAMQVEVSEGFEGMLPGGIDYKAFIDAIIQERYDLLGAYYDQITPRPYTIEYRNEDDIWDDFVMVPKNGKGSIWVHGIKGFPSSFKVQFRPNTFESTVAKLNSEMKRISDRAKRGGDCITCQLKNKGEKRILSQAEVNYIAAVRDAKVDLTVYKDHPQLKYLGKSIHDPEVIKLIAKDSDDSEKSLFISIDKSRYKWSEELNSKMRFKISRKGFWYVLDEISSTIAGVIFIHTEDKFRKWNAYKGNKPSPEKWIETSTLSRSQLYRIAPDKEQSFFQENLSLDNTQLLQQRANQGFLINSLADLDRFSKPRGEDIWRITGSPVDELLNKNLFAQKWAFDKSYNYGINEENEYQIEDNAKHILATRRNGYNYIFTGSSTDDYENGFFPLDIRIEFDLNIILPQVYKLPEFVSAKYKDSTIKISGREVVTSTIQIALDTKHGMRYMIITKYPDEEGGRFSKIRFSSETGFSGTGTPISLNYNPWKLHNENLVVVSRDDEKRYVSAFEKLFINMENGYDDIVKESSVLLDEEYLTVYLSDALQIPNTISGFSSVAKYKKRQASVYKMKVSKVIKDEYINTLFLNKWKGNYRLTAPEGDEESTFGKGIIVEKDNQVIGILQFDPHDTEAGIWWMEAHTFNEEAFEKSFEKMVTQANKDNYHSWKGLAASNGEHISTDNLYNSRLAFISDSLTEANEKETDIQFIFEGTPSYVLDFIIRKWQDAATSFSKEVRIKENFRRTYTTTRIVKFDFKGTQFLLVFDATHKNLNAIELSHGDNYDQLTEELFTPMNLEKATAISIKAAEAEGYEVVWSHTDDWQFLMQFNERFGSRTGNIAGDYMLTVVYEPTDIRSTYPSFGLSGNYNGDNISLRGKREEASSVIDDYMFNAIAFTLGNEKANYRVSGSYGYKDDGLIISVVLFKKK